MSGQRGWAVLAAASLLWMVPLVPSAFSEETAKHWKLDPILKTHTFITATDLSGPGRNVGGLPVTYGMSLFEFNWGGRQAAFNGSGITSNSSYPITEGSAVSTLADFGAAMTAPSGLELGVQAEEYALVGDKTAGRVFGSRLPWDNFDRQAGQVTPARSNLDFDSGWLKYARAPWSVQMVGGNLHPQTLPEFSRKPINYIRLGSLVWRSPIVNGSFFEKEDHRYEEGRQTLRGGDLIADYAYQSNRQIHLELFSGQTKPTPVADIDRLSWGGRLGADILDGNLGFTFVRADGDHPRSERQSVWAIDSSYPVMGWASLYGALARSSYTRNASATSLDGTAVVGGLALKGPHKSEAKVQYQWLGENYDLIGTHKTEHYPTNLRGVQGDFTVPILQKSAVKGVIYHLQQMETNTKTGDTIFGDSYFPALPNSKPGKITVWRLGGETGPWQRVKFNSYLEQAHFSKDALADADDINKWVTNVAAGATFLLTDQLSLEASLRHLMATGQWQTMRFHHRQEIPEFSLVYQKGKNLRASIIYHWYDFVDSIGASSGENNYQGHQVIAELLYKF